MKTPFILGGIAILSTAFNALAFQLDVPMVLNVTGSGLVQDLYRDAGDPDNPGPVEKLTTRSFKVTTKDIIRMLYSVQGPTDDQGNPLAPPSDGKLVYSGGGFSIISKRDGTVPIDSQYLSFEGDPTSGVESGTSNTDKGTAALTETYIFTLTFNDQAGTAFSFGGICAEKYSLGAPNADGAQKGTDAVTITGNGSGTLFDSTLILTTGKITGTGSGLVSQN